jgi:heme exporter protein A
MTMLDASTLTCVRGDRTLFSGISFSLAAGAGLLVQGANGAGKTSLLRILVGLAPAAEGSLAWDGTPVRALGEAYRRVIAYCGHAHALKDDLTAVENLQAAAALAGQPASDAQALAALERAGIGAEAALPARSLSQGQRRRVSLARLALARARLWVLDEPLAALDLSGIDWLAVLLDAHLAGGGLAVVTSHQPLPPPAAARFGALRIGA